MDTITLPTLLMWMVFPMTSAYAVDFSGRSKAVRFPNPYCQAIGQFLPHPTDRCQYLRCTYGSEPWRDAEGKIVLFSQEHQCPPGTAVNRTLFFYPEFGDSEDSFYYPITPCTIVDRTCVPGSAASGTVNVKRIDPTAGSSTEYSESEDDDGDIAVEKKGEGPEYVHPEDTIVTPEIHQKFALPYREKEKGDEVGDDSRIHGGHYPENNARRYTRAPDSRRSSGGEEPRGDYDSGIGRKRIPARVEDTLSAEFQSSDTTAYRPREYGREKKAYPDRQDTYARDERFGGIYNDAAESDPDDDDPEVEEKPDEADEYSRDEYAEDEGDLDGGSIPRNPTRESVGDTDSQDIADDKDDGITNDNDAESRIYQRKKHIDTDIPESSIERNHYGGDQEYSTNSDKVSATVRNYPVTTSEQQEEFTTDRHDLENRDSAKTSSQLPSSGRFLRPYLYYIDGQNFVDMQRLGDTDPTDDEDKEPAQQSSEAVSSDTEQPKFPTWTYPYGIPIYPSNIRQDSKSQVQQAAMKQRPGTINMQSTTHTRKKHNVDKHRQVSGEHEQDSSIHTIKRMKVNFNADAFSEHKVNPRFDRRPTTNPSNQHEFTSSSDTSPQHTKKRKSRVAARSNKSPDHTNSKQELDDQRHRIQSEVSRSSRASHLFASSDSDRNEESLKSLSASQLVDNSLRAYLRRQYSQNEDTKDDADLLAAGSVIQSVRYQPIK